MKEVAVRTLDEIHQKLLKSQELARFTASENEPREIKRWRELKERFGDSRLVRSDNFIENSQAFRLYIKTENLRNKLFAKGKDITSSPKYKIEQTGRSAEEAKRFFFIDEDDFEIYADLDPLADNTGDKLTLAIKQDPKIVFSLNYLDGYWISITYGSYGERGYADYFNTDFLTSMTQEEYSIVSPYMSEIGSRLDAL